MNPRAGRGIGLLLVLLLVPACGSGRGTGFSAPPRLSFLTQQSPAIGAVAFVMDDFNHDGLPDLAVLSAAPAVTLFLGDGLGGFTAGTPAAISGPGVAMAAIDVDRDGELDVVVAYATGGFTILGGDGAGNLGPASDKAATGTFAFMAVADLDGNGYDDVILGDAVAPAIVVLMGGNASTFAAPTTTSLPSALSALLVRDFDGDGKPDLLTAHRSASVVRFAAGDGLGGWGTPANVTLASPPTGLATADLTNDRIRDLLVTEDAGIELFPGVGDGTFSPSTSIPTPNAASRPVIADFDGDRRPDLAYADTASAVHVLFGAAGGTFSGSADFFAPDVPTQFVPGDWNRDGRADLAAICPGVGRLVLLLNNSSFTAAPGTFNPRQSFPSIGSPSTVVAGNFNTQPGLDLAVNQNNNVRIFNGTGTGAFVSGTPVTASTNCTRIIAADFTNDGKLDIADTGASTGQIRFHTNLGATFLTSAPINAGTQIQSLASGEFSNDANLDLIAVDHGGKAIVLLQGLGAGNFLPPVLTGLPFAPLEAAVADLDGDLRDDIVVVGDPITTPAPAPAEITVLLQQGGSPGSFVPVTVVVGGHPQGVVIADFTGDGIPDIAYTDGVRDQVVLLPGLGGGAFGTPRRTRAGKFPRGIVAGDFDGDGRPDIAVSAFDGNTVTIYSCPAGEFERILDVPRPTGDGPCFLTAADFNGDGKIDLAVPETNGGGFSILLNR